MIQLTPHMRIFLAVEPVDFRKGIDGHAAVCRQVLGRDPFDGAIFVFRNRRATALRILHYDGQGFWLCYKRLSRGRLTWWPKSTDDPVMPLAVHELQMLLWNGDPSMARVAPPWRPLRKVG